MVLLQLVVATGHVTTVDGGEHILQLAQVSDGDWYD